MPDPLWSAITLGTGALLTMLVCFGYLTYENAGSKTFTLAAAALLSAVFVFVLQALFELRSTVSKTFVTAEYTLDRAKPEIRQWAYSANVGWRIHVELGASQV